MESSEKDNIHVFRVNRETPVRDVTSAATGSKSRTSLSGGTKRLICEDHIQNPRSTQEELATKYGCKRTTIAKIIKGKDRWLSIDSDVTAKRFRQRTSRYPVIEEALLVWIQKEQRDCKVITDQMLQAQARLYAQTFDNAGQDFKASSSWLTKFKERYMNTNSRLETSEQPLENTPPPPTHTTIAAAIAAVSASPSPSCVKNHDNNDDNDNDNDNDDDDDDDDDNTQVLPTSEKTSVRNQLPEWRYPNDGNGDNQAPLSTPLPEKELLDDDTSKDHVRQHLEAVLSYYTSKNQASSMSAELIRLVLKKDF